MNSEVLCCSSSWFARVCSSTVTGLLILFLLAWAFANKIMCEISQRGWRPQYWPLVNCLTVYGMETFSRAGLHSGWSTVWESLIQKWVRSQIFSSLLKRPFSVRDGLNMILHFGIFQRWTAAMHWTWAPRLIFAYHWMSFKEGFQLDAV